MMVFLMPQKKSVLCQGIPLFTGDINPREEKGLRGIYEGRLKVDVSKVTHLRRVSIYALIEAVDPKIAISTVGLNPYATPDPQTIRAHTDRDCPVLRTDTYEEGISIKTDGKNIWWETGER
jgi:beta-lactamase superfamily II metal-dependent hydrolase